MAGNGNNKLKDSELFALGVFLKTRERQIHAEKPTLSALAQQCTDGLPFVVTKYNLGRGLRAAGIVYTKKAKACQSKARLERHERILAALCAKLGEDMEALANAK
jgi:hypothetical protein